MPYKISGTAGETSRILILKETDYSIESSTEENGSYLIEGLDNSSKFILARNSNGETVGYSGVTPVYYDNTPVDVTYSIVDGNDDAYRQATSWLATVGYIKFYRSSGGAFLRFTGVAIPKGSTITSAFVRLRAYPTAGSDGNQIVNIACDAIDNSFQIGDVSTFLGRPRTSSVSWSTLATESVALGTIHDSPSIITPIQEIINRTGWNSGNAISVLIDTTTTVADRAYCSFEHSTQPGPELHISYIAP